MTENLTPEPCTTSSQRMRHYSVNLAYRRLLVGRGGTTLCGHDADDEERANDWNARYSKRRVVVADLPVCKLCARKTGGA